MLFHRQLVDDPRLPLGVDDHFLTCMCQNASAPFFVEHAVVVGAIGHDVALVAGHDAVPQIGSMLASIIQSAVAARRDVDLHAQFKVLQRAPHK